MDHISNGGTLAVFAGMLAGFYAIAKIMLKQASKDRDADRQERLELSKAIQAMADSSQEVAEATKKAANEAAERNGHLGEQHIVMLDGVKKIAEKLETDGTS